MTIGVRVYLCDACARMLRAARDRARADGKNEDEAIAEAASGVCAKCAPPGMRPGSFRVVNCIRRPS
jgi:hypothetical protein